MNSFQESIERIHCKRRSFQDLSRDEFAILLADTIMDRRLFSGPNWNWRYGGVRYVPRPLPPVSPGKILVLQWPGSLGDVCMAAPFLSVLRQRYPRAKISLLSSIAALEVYTGSRDIDTVVPNPLEPHVGRMLSAQEVSPESLLKDIHGLSAMLAGEKYDLAVNLQILPMSATLARLSGARETIGMTLSGDGMPVIRGNLWAPYLFGVSANLMRKYNPLHRTEIFRLMVDEEQRFTPRPTVSISPDAVRSVQQFLDRGGVGDHELLIGLNPMASTPIRQWPYFDQLARMLRNRLGARVMIFGSKAEDHEVEAIVRRSGTGVIKATHFTLQELMAAVSGCDLFISNDTGPMHLACLLGRKVIGLFGPTGYREVGPWLTKFHLLQSSVCRGCFRQKCARPAEFCMNRISVDEVYGLVESELQGKPYRHVNRDTLLYPAVEGVHPDEAKWRLGSILLEVLRQRGRGAAKGDAGAWRDRPHGEDLPHQCIRLKAMSEEAIRSLSNRGNGEMANVFLKPLEVMNDLEFLDKRILPEKDLEASLRFHQGLHRDLITLTAMLGDTTVEEWKAC